MSLSWNWELLGGRVVEVEMAALELESVVFLQHVARVYEDASVSALGFIAQVFCVENPWARETEDGVEMIESDGFEVLLVFEDMIERRLTTKRHQEEQNLAQAPELVDTGRVMEILGVHRASVYGIRDRGHLKAHRVGGRWVYELESVFEYKAKRVRRGRLPAGQTSEREPLELDEEGFVWPTAQVREVLEVTTAAVYAMRDADHIQARKVGGRWLYHPDDIRAFAAFRKESVA